jgi:hypothetical protein
MYLFSFPFATRIIFSWASLAFCWSLESPRFLPRRTRNRAKARPKRPWHHQRPRAKSECPRTRQGLWPHQRDEGRRDWQRVHPRELVGRRIKVQLHADWKNHPLGARLLLYFVKIMTRKMMMNGMVCQSAVY